MQNSKIDYICHFNALKYQILKNVLEKRLVLSL